MSTSQQKAKASRNAKRETTKSLEALKQLYIEDICAVLNQQQRTLCTPAESDAVEKLVALSENDLKRIKKLINEKFYTIAS